MTLRPLREGGCDVFFILQEKIISSACLLGSELTVIFH